MLYVFFFFFFDIDVICIYMDRMVIKKHHQDQ